MTAHLPSIVSVGCALPEHHVDQETIAASLKSLWAKKHYNPDRLAQLHRSVKVSGRYLAVPPDAMRDLDSFGKRNDVWIRVALDVGEKAVRRALDAANLTVRDVDHIFFTTVTGISTPSIEARLANRMGMRPDVKRTPLFGLGCVAGAAGTARASDYLRAFPNDICVLLAVELCSLTLQQDDLSIPNIIASGLFGDGAAAVVLEGAARRDARLDKPNAAPAGLAPQVVATQSVLYPDSERVMGWDVVDTGFKLVLSPDVPAIVQKHIPENVDAFLAKHGIGRKDIAHWVVHTGGPKVLEAFEKSLDLPAKALAGSWRALEETGNLSSASVLFVLRELLDSRVAKTGDYGLLAAMGPGFCSELVLLRW